MKLENTFIVPVSVAETWRVLLDVERIAPCVPGASLESRDGDSYRGRVKVKLGPIGLTYGGTVTFVSTDEEAGVAVLEAKGREARGGGTARAMVTCRLSASGGSATEVLVETDLAITGKPAQFGRGTLNEVAGSLIGTFAANLAEEITRDDDTPETPSTEDTNDVRDANEAKVDAAAATTTAAEPLDLIRAAGGSVRRIALAAAGTILVIIIALIVWWWGG
jgi:carbon monoxide dehydrogenase subunit G